MRVVLYTNDFEPITVIELPSFAEEYLRRYGAVRLAVILPLSMYTRDTDPPNKSGCRTVRIHSERFWRNGAEHTILFTADEESALLLKSAFLPGQQSELNERERNAFARGFLEALCRL